MGEQRRGLRRCLTSGVLLERVSGDPASDRDHGAAAGNGERERIANDVGDREGVFLQEALKKCGDLSGAGHFARVAVQNCTDGALELQHRKGKLCELEIILPTTPSTNHLFNRHGNLVLRRW